MPRLPVVSAEEAIKTLEHFGFKVYRQTGSHIHLWNEERNLVVTVPNHPELAKGTLLSIMKQARLERKEFIYNIHTFFMSAASRPAGLPRYGWGRRSRPRPAERRQLSCRLMECPNV